MPLRKTERNKWRGLRTTFVILFLDHCVEDLWIEGSRAEAHSAFSAQLNSYHEFKPSVLTERFHLVNVLRGRGDIAGSSVEIDVEPNNTAGEGPHGHPSLQETDVGGNVLLFPETTSASSDDVSFGMNLNTDGTTASNHSEFSLGQNAEQDGINRVLERLPSTREEGEKLDSFSSSHKPEESSHSHSDGKKKHQRRKVKTEPKSEEEQNRARAQKKISHPRKCNWSEGCERQATYGSADGVTFFCLEHKQDHHTNVRLRQCRFSEGCRKQASYGDAVERIALFCNAHRQKSHVNVVSPRCKFADCARQPVFGDVVEQLPIYCAAHKRAGDVNVVRGRKCVHIGCKKQPAFGDPSTAVPEFCLQHRPSADYLNLIAKRCEAEGCTSRPSFGSPNSSTAQFCATHKPAEFINVYNKKCNFDSCTRQASYGEEGAKKPLRCAPHRLPGMVHMWGLCQHTGCTLNASMGSLKDRVRRFCARHADRRVHVHLRSVLKRAQFNLHKVAKPRVVRTPAVVAAHNQLKTGDNGLVLPEEGDVAMAM
mmetsp:Transcript_36730/g.86429  ORF Transcript_36730/g.86429 Transcript_36730/m.86429 type:complete len:538 (+) Transcript_36730:190-1803(+)